MPDGNPQLGIRVAPEVKDRVAAMRADGHDLATIFHSLTGAWEALGKPDADAFLDALRGLSASGEVETAVQEREHQLRSRQSKLAHREREVERREQEIEQRAQAAEARRQTAEAQAAAVEARSGLRRQVIDVGEAMLHAGAKPNDAFAVFRAVQAAKLDSEGVAKAIEQLGGVIATIRKYGEQADALRQQIDGLTQQRDTLAAEVRGLEAAKSQIQTQVGAAVDVATKATLAALEPMAQRAEAQAAHLESTACRATAAAEALVAASQQNANEIAQAVLHQALVPFEPAILRMAEIGALAEAVDGVARVDRIAVARAILAPLTSDDYDTREALKNVLFWLARLTEKGDTVRGTEPAAVAQ